MLKKPTKAAVLNNKSVMKQRQPSNKNPFINNLWTTSAQMFVERPGENGADARKPISRGAFRAPLSTV
jgi:hypothetical protein